jgi:AraC-like DNA-binding protein
MASPPTVPVFRSRLAFVGDSSCPGAACDSTGEELADGHSMTFVRRGVFVRQIGRQRMIADPNHIVFFVRERPFRITHVAGCTDECTVFSLRMDVLLDVFGRRDPHADAQPGRPFGLDAVPASADLHRAHLELFAQVRSRMLTDVAAEEAVIRLFERMLADAHPAPSRQDRSSAATRRAHAEIGEAAQRLLASRFRQPLSLDDVAGAVHTSPFHLCRIFRATTGRSIAAYRNQLRLRAALERLACGASDITALAFELGYADHSHLTNSFRRAFGVAPAAFRRSLSSNLLRETSTILQVGSSRRA